MFSNGVYVLFAGVLVTGASGFIATHIIKQLQEEGYQVRGTLRSLEDKDKVGGYTVTII